VTASAGVSALGAAKTGSPGTDQRQENGIMDDQPRGIRTYRQLALRCRELAAGSSHPGVLLRRAEAFEAQAALDERERTAPAE
jgi:hypothetical protein